MLIFLVSLAACMTFILISRKAAHGFGLVDLPGGRKKHLNPTPAVGGLAMFMGVLLSLLVGGELKGNVLKLLLCSAVLIVLGVLDDKNGLAVRIRLMIQVVVVLVIIIAVEGSITHLGALFGSNILLGMFAIPFSVLAFVGGINAINMIDGVDGIAGKMVSITLSGLAIIFHLAGVLALMPLTLALFGALAGFLMFNSRIFVRRAWVFMGDAGSMWLGVLMCWFMVQLTRGSVSAEPALALWLFGVPLIDTLAVMLRRLRFNSSAFAADRTHIHHILEHAGFSVRRTVLVLSVVQIVLVGIGVYFYIVGATAAVVCWSFVLLFAGYCYQLRFSVLRDRRKLFLRERRGVRRTKNLVLVSTRKEPLEVNIAEKALVKSPT